jgi:hypothetical protein
MSLYDDVDTKQIPDWSSGLKLVPQTTLAKQQQTKKPNVKNKLKKNKLQFSN